MRYSVVSLLPALLAAAVTVPAMVVLRRVAATLRLLDVPRGHKTHDFPVPVVGGIAMYVGLLVSLLLTPGGGYDERLFLACGALLVAIGARDDAHEVSPWLRLGIHTAVAFTMLLMSTTTIRLTSLGNVFGHGAIDVTAVAIPATLLVTVATINAFNMLDGLDGLAGGVALVSLSLLLLDAPGTLSPSFLQIVVGLVGALAGFLLFNAPLGFNRRWRCFMGDAGSTLLGFGLAIVLIGASQGPARAAAPVTMIWLVLVPASDLVWTVTRRLSGGLSPFAPDTAHLHHVLREAGLSARATAMALVATSGASGLLGLELERAGVPERVSLGACVLVGALIVLAAHQVRPRPAAAASAANE